MIGDHFYTTSASERDNAVMNIGYSSEGTACKIYPQMRPVQTGDHFYTTSQAVHDSMIQTYGYRDEGIACYVAPSAVGAAVPLYRLLNFSVWDSFYTTSAAERDFAVAHYGYVYQDITCFVLATQAKGTVPLFRLRSLQSGDHFYTTSAPERDNAINSYHYVSEGTACYVYPAAAAGRVALLRLSKISDPFATVPLYRLLGATGDHFYTISDVERAAAIAHSGYHLEGVAGFVHDIQHATPLYRIRSTDNGDHFYTISAFERDNAIAHYHYVSEGIACGVLQPNEQPWVGVSTPFYRLLKTSDPVVQPTGALTCDGKVVTAATQTFIFAAQDNASKQLYPNTVSVKANSLGDAQQCAQNSVNALVAGATAVPLQNLRTFYFAVYGPDECFTESILNTSSADATTALRHTVCSNCNYADITAAITNSDGSIDGDVLDNWCAANPAP